MSAPEIPLHWCAACNAWHTARPHDDGAISTTARDLSATVERIKELDRRYLLADRLYREWMMVCCDKPVRFPDYDQAYERWQQAKRRYEALRDSEEGMP